MNRSHHLTAQPLAHRLPRVGPRPLASSFVSAPWIQSLTLLLVFGLLAWVGLLQIQTPDIVPASAPATEFSAERAMADLRIIAAEPRPIGSPANAAVRQYLIDQIRALGLEPQVQTTAQVVSEGEEGFRAGIVNNVYVRVPGTASTGVIAINAHYDAANTGPGASDAGSGVVAALETLRAVMAGPQLRNDLLFVFVDGEERHMLGSAAFTEQHRWAGEIRLTLNYEAVGSGGPAFLYVTSEDNDWLVSEFLDVAPDPSAYSLIATISNLFPEGRFDSDLGEYTEVGSQGLGFLYAADPTAYHSARDNVEQIDQGSIQQEGAYTLAVAQHFGHLDLTDMPRSGDRVFFNVLPGVVVHYEAIWAIPLAAVITAAIAGLVVVGVRRRHLTGRGLVVGSLAGLLGTLGAVGLVALLWAAIRWLNLDYQVQMVGHYQTTLHVIILILATIAILAAFFILLGRTVRRHNLMAGVLLGSLLPLWLLSLAAPGASYIVTWPLLFAVLPLAWTLLARGCAAGPWIRVAVLAIAAIPVFILLPGTLYQIVALAVRFEGTLGVPVLGLTMLFVAPLVTLFVPHLHVLSGESASRRVRWAVPAGATLAAVALIAWATATSGFDAEQPRPDQIAYELNADTGRAQWVSFDTELDGWTEQFFPAGAERSDHERLAHGTTSAFTAPAPAVPLTAPEVTVVGDTMDGDVRTLRLRLASPRGTTEMSTVVTAPGEIVSAVVDGRPLNLSEYGPAADGELTVIYANVPAGGWELTLAVRSREPVTIEIEEATDGLPDALSGTISPRPAETMPSPLYPRDATVVTKTVEI